MCHYVLKFNGEFIARSTVVPIPEEDLTSHDIKIQMDEYTKKLHAAIGDHEKALVHDNVSFDPKLDKYSDCLYISEEDDAITYL